MTDAPATIYLTRGYNDEPCGDDGCEHITEDACWSQDSQCITDVEYVRRDAIKRCPMSCAWGIAGNPRGYEIGKCPRCDGAGFVVGE